jgi:hypothetical protein
MYGKKADAGYWMRDAQPGRQISRAIVLESMTESRIAFRFGENGVLRIAWHLLISLGGGNFSNTIPVLQSEPSRYFVIKIP